MITAQQIRARVHGMYTPMVRRFGPKYWHTGRRQGKLRTPGQQLPFTEPELLGWLMRSIGFNAMPCPYCGVPVDALSCSLDHDQAVSRGGSLALDNLVLMCAGCNRLKGALSGVEFKAFLDGMHTFHPDAQKDVFMRLRSGAMGMRLRFIKPPAKLKPTIHELQDF